MDLITDEELKVLKGYHQAMPSNPKFCRGCANLSPCPTARLIEDWEFVKRQLEGSRILSREFEARCKAAGLIE